MFSFNSIRKKLRYRIGKSVAFLLLTVVTVSALLMMSGSSSMAQFAQLDQHKSFADERGKPLLAQLPLPDYLLIGAVTSEPRPQHKQKTRSSGNFNVQAPANRIYWAVLEGNFQSPNVRFNIMWDRRVRKDPILARGLRNGSITSGNQGFFQRSIYIANPSGAGGNFQVIAYRYGQ
jgi:hypothetical protein